MKRVQRPLHRRQRVEGMDLVDVAPDSNMLSPASRHTSTSRVAPATSLAPQALKSSVLPPNVPVPRQSTGTAKPDLPSCRDCIMSLV
jgi:hypothetical protein